MTWLDAIGWIGSVLLIWSLALANVLRFRLLNLLASLVLTGFNAAIEVWPMVAMNAAIVVINVAHLVRLLRTRDDGAAYEVVEVGPTEDYLRHLLRRFGADIEHHNPGFVWDGAAPGRLAFLVLRGSETVGLVLMREAGDGIARVDLDYVTPRFRDLSVGKFVYRGGVRLAERGVRRLVATRRMRDADDYFPRVGFRRQGKDLVLDVAP